MSTTTKEVIKPHIAFLSSPALSHVIQILEFAKHLVIHHNVHVSFLVINSGAPPVLKLLLHPSNLPDDLHVINLPPADVSSCEGMNLLAKITCICKESLKSSLRATLVDLNTLKALVIDMFIPDAFPICEELGLPVYVFYVFNTKVLALCFYLPKLDKETEGHEYVDLPGPIQIPGYKPLQIEDLPDGMLNRKDEDYTCFLDHVSRLTMAAGVFVNTCDDLESKLTCLKGIENDPFYKALPVPPVYPVGPIVKRNEALSESDAYIMSWLDQQSADSVILVTFGSGGTFTSKQLNELAWGLEMSKQKFIFVVRKPSDLSACGTFFNVGKDEEDSHDQLATYLPEGFMERTDGVGLVVASWAPQSTILSHKATGGLLFHGGWASALESIVHGVPMIAWPLYAEQRMNAAMLVEELEIAVRPIAVSADGEMMKVVTREEVERVVRLVMEGEQCEVMRSKVNQLKESAAEALKVGGSSYDLLSSLVQSWK